MRRTYGRLVSSAIEVEGGHGAEAIWLPCLVLAGVTVVVAAVATRVFRWEST